MESIPQLERRLDDGEHLLNRLADDGVAIRRAYWSRPPEDDRWILSLAMPVADVRGVRPATERVAEALKCLPRPELQLRDVRVRGAGFAASDPIEELAGRAVGAWHRVRGSFWPVYIYAPAVREEFRTGITAEQKQILQELYWRTPLAVDELPYTDDMQAIYDDFKLRTGLHIGIRDVYKAVKNLGRQGRLGGKRRQVAEAGMPNLFG